MQLPAGPIFHHRLSALPLLNQEGQVAPVPTKGGGLVGLMASQVTQREHLAAAPLLQDHRGAAAPFDEGGEQAPITAEGW